MNMVDKYREACKRHNNGEEYPFRDYEGMVDECRKMNACPICGAVACHQASCPEAKASDMPVTVLAGSVEAGEP